MATKNFQNLGIKNHMPLKKLKRESLIKNLSN